MKALPAALFSCTVWLAAITSAFPTNQKKPDCKNYNTDFRVSTEGWSAENTVQDTYDITDGGIKMNLMPPRQYVRMHDAQSAFHYLPYNKYEGRGPTFNASSYMHYGRVSATVKSANVGGAITAVILIGDGGDEIDFELLGGMSNYFWGHEVLYTVNGGYHEVAGGPVFDEYHTYTIDWTPDRIDWYIDGTLVRTKEKKDTCDGAGVCKFPSEPARIQIGLWDGSIESGTAQWSRGPIAWEQHDVISAYIQKIESVCNPEYNNVVA
ncbi:concanavalin A-like lectin/glucanase domain-containing protein [Zychaea mexicana]|uniref:concanavalin A-like lectin/glucanase domain-containing protein n=1 Tax=Zychaea mexicana TaxID=64656 RepID=UPI0022FDDEC6|nr:concanavalin A-like lectin/glucanase domain-containing protein [Zychaea mexicana]KAI9488808.1 concanavalin A-like lectin/glucanase domain-containing protein [Zychaea mexicana]